MFVGTSGWQYADWRGAFYPQRVAQSAWLKYYAERFATVEVNNSFYRLPARETFTRWADGTPDDFVVAVKASRYLSHFTRLREPAEPVARLMGRATGLGAKLGPVLVQLPASFQADAGRLAAALDEFPAGVRIAVELRHPSWFVDQVRRTLAAHNAALCWADRDSRWLAPLWRTADWGYVRFHAGTARPAPCYAAPTLASRARDVARIWGEGDDCFVYFNNDPRCCAIRDAVLFARACAAHGLRPTRVPKRREVRVVA